MIANSLLVALLCATGLVTSRDLLPPVPETTESRSGNWSLGLSPKTIYIEDSFAATVDNDGLTLIPPAANDFAALFRDDLSELTGWNWTLHRVAEVPSNASGIFLGAFSEDVSKMTYENGKATSEGYEIDINSNTVSILGTGARGMWWGTRTFLQLLLVGNGIVSTGRIVDAPAFATRGYLLDAGRKWYSKDFLKELCSYASFYKMSEFHYHMSDNYPLNRGKNETWQDVYSHFSLLPEDESLRGILHGRENETLSRTDFADLQKHCASRGITVIPEIEAPGHCLYLTKWKPELALAKKDLLNLTHPETIPTVKRIWKEFLPWFETKEVHIGADEYDATLADDYIAFVNEMRDFVNSTAQKKIRIWGTNEPSKNLTIDTNVIIQHWQYGESDPVTLVDDGYDIINSEDRWAYMSLKSDHMPILPAKYPQFFDEDAVFKFGGKDQQWSPSDYNPFNLSMQLKDEEPLNKGAIMAAWNDNGPDATTQLEAYYAMRRGFGLVGARAWSGTRGPQVRKDTYDSSADFFSPRIPGQNLDRIVWSQNKGSLQWTRSTDDGQQVHLGHGSKGMNYTLDLSVTGPFVLDGTDNTLKLDSDGVLTFHTDGWEYPLRQVDQLDALTLDPGHPGRIWVNSTSSTHEIVKISTPANITIATDVLHGSVVWVNAKLVGRFEVYVYGGKNKQFSWNQMAFVAPLDSISGMGLGSLTIDGSVNFNNIGKGTKPPTISGGLKAASRPNTYWVVLMTLGIMGVCLMS